MSILKQIESAMRVTSRIKSLPGINIISPSVAVMPSEKDLEGYLHAQELAFAGTTEIAGFLREGWTEKQAATLLNTWLQDNGVKSFFHYAYAWFGERSRFTGINRLRYSEFEPTKRVLQPNEVFILDVAPIVNGYVCDIGYTGSLGQNSDLEKATQFLGNLRKDIITLFRTVGNGSEIWQIIARKITESGYDNIHALYPFSVLGHRVFRGVNVADQIKLFNFGWQSYWSLFSRGVFGQILNANFEGNLLGLWAIEPHIGGIGFGAKFEEILVVEQDSVYWLKDKRMAKIPQLKGEHL